MTQEEVAVLLGYEGRSSVSRVERGKQIPTLGNVLALEVLFGVAPKELFPALFQEAEETLLRRALPLYEATLKSSTSAAARKRRALDEAMERATKPRTDQGV